jgi:hypothetical protein
MAYVETTTIVRMDKKGRLIRQRVTTYVDGSAGLIEERVERRYLPEDEYFTRKSFDGSHRSSMDRIFDAYRDFQSGEEWD